MGRAALRRAMSCGLPSSWPTASSRTAFTSSGVAPCAFTFTFASKYASALARPSRGGAPAATSKASPDSSSPNACSGSFFATCASSGTASGRSLSNPSATSSPLQPRIDALHTVFPARQLELRARLERQLLRALLVARRQRPRQQQARGRRTVVVRLLERQQRHRLLEALDGLGLA